MNEIPHLGFDKPEEYETFTTTNGLEEAAIQAAQSDMQDRQIMEASNDERMRYSRIFRRGFKAGVKWDREQMLKEAVEGEIYGNIRNQEEKPYQIWAESDFLPLGEKFEIGDKVRIIIVKEDSHE